MVLKVGKWGQIHAHNFPRPVAAIGVALTIIQKERIVIMLNAPFGISAATKAGVTVKNMGRPRQHGKRISGFEIHSVSRNPSITVACAAVLLRYKIPVERKVFGNTQGFYRQQGATPA